MSTIVPAPRKKDADRKKKESDPFDLVVYIEVFEKFGPLAKPAIRISKFLSKKEDVQAVIKKAMSDDPLKAYITFKKKNLVIPRLARLGLIDPDDLED